MTDRFGNVHHVGLLGIGRSGVDYVRRDPVSAVWRAAEETWNLSTGTLRAVWQMIVGSRTTDELGGPIAIGKMAGEVAQGGVVPLDLVHGGSVGQSWSHQPVSHPGP